MLENNEFIKWFTERWGVPNKPMNLKAMRASIHFKNSMEVWDAATEAAEQKLTDTLQAQTANFSELSKRVDRLEQLTCKLNLSHHVRG